METTIFLWVKGYYYLQLIQTGFEQNLDNLELQWGSEIGTPLDFEWSKRGWFAKGLDFEWDLKSRSPSI